MSLTHLLAHDEQILRLPGNRGNSLPICVLGSSFCTWRESALQYCNTPDQLLFFEPPNPITAAIIAAVETCVQTDKMDKLHIQSELIILLYDSSKIIGVDYTESTLQNKDETLQEDQNKAIYM